jgi:hypothetical protein
LDGASKVLHYSFTGDTPSHPGALSVIMPHDFSWVMLQATIAIFLLVGFESVTPLGEEAKNPKRDIPRAVLLSLTIQGIEWLGSAQSREPTARSGSAIKLRGRAVLRHNNPKALFRIAGAPITD